MSYREENGQVVVTMSREDFERVLSLLGAGSGALRDPLEPDFRIRDTFALMDRLNEGNPNWTPYNVRPR